MRISSDTSSILKNFSEINQSIRFRVGSKVSTLHPEKVVMAEADVAERFETDCNIYDLSRVLSITQIFEDPNYIFGEESLQITSGNKDVSVRYCDPCLITTAENSDNLRKKIEDSKVAETSITKAEFKNIKQSAQILGLPNIVVIASNGCVQLKTTDVQNPSSDVFTLDLVGTVHKDYEAIINVAHFKLLEGDYDIVISEGLGYFKNKNLPVEYWVAFQSV